VIQTSALPETGTAKKSRICRNGVEPRPRQREERGQDAGHPRDGEVGEEEALLPPGIHEVAPEPVEHQAAEEQVERTVLDEHPGEESPDLPLPDRSGVEEEHLLEAEPAAPAHRRDEAHHDGRHDDAAHRGGDPPAEGEEVSGAAGRQRLTLPPACRRG
jgi:hypothetical protein